MDPDGAFSHPCKSVMKPTARFMFSSRMESVGGNDRSAGDLADNLATMVFFFQSNYLKNTAK